MDRDDERHDELPYAATRISAPYDDLAPIPVAVLLDDIRSLYNVGAFFRTADGAGLSRVYLTGITGTPPQPAIEKTALGAEHAVPWEHHGDPLALATHLAAAGWSLVAIETSTHALDLFDWTPRFPVCAMFGHEVRGLRAELRAAADHHVRLPMLGVKHSLNVAAAGAVVLYELLRKYRRLVETGQTAR